MQKLGAGEIIVTSIDHEGKKNGFNVSLYKEIKKKSDIPIVAHGGAGNINHIIEVFTIADVDAVSIASILHYSYMKNIHTNKEQGNKRFMKNYNANNMNYDITNIKKELLKNNINIRKNV